MNLSLSELSKKLNLPDTTIERWIRQGRIPVIIEKGRCIFKKSSLVKWAAKHNLKFSIAMDEEDSFEIGKEVTLVSSLEKGDVFYQVKGDGIESVLSNAVDMIEEFDDTSKKELLEKLIERENLTSTGIGNGIAIPHPRIPVAACSEASVYACYLNEAVDFNAIDNLPVTTLFILLSPSTKEHLNLLSKLAFCMRDPSFISFIKSQPSKDELIKKVDEFEKKSK